MGSDLKRAFIWMAWGEKYVQDAAKSFASVRNAGYHYCGYLITDENTFNFAKGLNVFNHVIKAKFLLEGNRRKSELWRWIPGDYNSYLFLDVDTRILENIDLGFEMAEKWGIAVVPAAHYCLDYFWGFRDIMIAEGVEPKGQLQYNSGVIFFANRKEVFDVFKKWNDLAGKYKIRWDQPLLTLAMELLDFNPYVLSPNYNYRGMGVPIIGNVRIWHTYHEPPKELNEQPGWWPMRYFVDGKFYRPGYKKWLIKQYLKRILRI